nr:DUF1643 domain-containing protein [uncultured Cohaesibacter sp.]
MTSASIQRQHIDAEKHLSSLAHYSPCETYRYSLTRIWEPQAPKLLFIMLNPSTATELKNDPTIERCEQRARALSYGSFRACNLFAFRATEPRDLKRTKEPIGPENLTFLLQSARWADSILCAWGTHGAYMGMGDAVKNLLLAEGHSLFHLGLSKNGFPKHPLYVAYKTTPTLWL